jgi:hypothetical protein
MILVNLDDVDPDAILFGVAALYLSAPNSK